MKSNYEDNFKKAKAFCGNECRACNVDLTDSQDCVFMFAEHFNDPPKLNLTNEWEDVECQLSHFILLCPECHRDALAMMHVIQDMLKKAAGVS